jgi:hypothetical protein
VLCSLSDCRWYDTAARWYTPTPHRGSTVTIPCSSSMSILCSAATTSPLVSAVMRELDGGQGNRSPSGSRAQHHGEAWRGLQAAEAAGRQHRPDRDMHTRCCTHLRSEKKVGYTTLGATHTVAVLALRCARSWLAALMRAAMRGSWSMEMNTVGGMPGRQMQRWGKVDWAQQ